MNFVLGVVWKGGRNVSRRGDAIYHRKDGLWEARYVKEIDIYGKKKYGSVYGHSYREAKEKRQDAMDRILLYQKAMPTRRITVSELGKEWLYINQNRLKLSSYQRYEGFLRNHIDALLGKTSVVYLTTASLHAFSQDRLNAGLSPQSVNAILTFLHSVLKYGHRQYNLPLPEFIYLSCSKKEMRVLSKQEQKRLVDYLLKDLDVYKLGVLVALFTGLRIGELCALRWSDISDNSIKVRKTMQRLKKTDGTGTILFVGDPKTETSSRMIPIPSFLSEKIETFRPTKYDNGYFLSPSEKEIIEPRNMQYKFQKYLKEAEITDATFHTLRHSFATRCVECGFELKSLSEILGHANVQITLNKYVHSSFELKQTNMELLNSVL